MPIILAAVDKGNRPIWIHRSESVPSDRQQEIKRRRHRAKKLQMLKKRLEKGTVSQKEEIIRKIRLLTPGADVVIANWGLNELDR
jgi:hypothetical protein